MTSASNSAGRAIVRRQLVLAFDFVDGVLLDSHDEPHVVGVELAKERAARIAPIADVQSDRFRKLAPLVALRAVAAGERRLQRAPS